QERREELSIQGAEQRVIGVYAAPVAETAGVQAGAMLVLHDWTERWRTERMRREFVANASHELRTPIAAVKMMTETLLEGAMDDPNVRDRFLRLVAREADRLGQLVSGLLDLSRMESGEWEVEREVFPVREVIEPVVAKFSLVVNSRQQHLSTDVPADLLVCADRRALTQVLDNLIENASKYTPNGGSIWVTAGRQNERVCISVRDTGIGIPLEHQRRVFERFYRVDKARSRERGGTGLGLSIVKHLVEAQNGSVEVESEPGKGSTFRVLLPAPEASGEGDQPVSAPANPPAGPVSIADHPLPPGSAGAPVE
ncbi:MAG: ATP-binding protein, partial [Armatimonadota bacterium]|nr:ATP-binding protein [Armatimonadota bacterium]